MNQNIGAFKRVLYMQKKNPLVSLFHSSIQNTQEKIGGKSNIFLQGQKEVERYLDHSKMLRPLKKMVPIYSYCY